MGTTAFNRSNRTPAGPTSGKVKLALLLPNAMTPSCSAAFASGCWHLSPTRCTSDVATSPHAICRAALAPHAELKRAAVRGPKAIAALKRRRSSTITACASMADTESRGEYVPQLAFVEIGTGCDLHGQDVTTAAVRACRGMYTSVSAAKLFANAVHVPAGGGNHEGHASQATRTEI